MSPLILAVALTGYACAPGSFDPAWQIHEVRLVLTAPERAALDSLSTIEADALVAIMGEAGAPGNARRIATATMRVWGKL